MKKRERKRGRVTVNEIERESEKKRERVTVNEREREGKRDRSERERL